MTAIPSAGWRFDVATALCRRLPPMASQRLFMALRAYEHGGPARTFVAPTITGSRFTYLTGDMLADTVRACGFWDWRNLALAAAFCSPGDRIIEVGANTGTETLGFSDIVGPTGRVTAFEPVPDIRAALEENLRLNGRSNVTVRAAAVADRAGTVRFLPSAHSSNSGTGHIAFDDSEDGRALDVPVVSLDDLAEELGTVAFIAIDVEGHEVAVIEGASAYMRTYRPAVVVEACSSLLARAGTSLCALRDRFGRLEYDVFEIGKVRLHAFSDARAQDPRYERNWLCLPRERSGARRKADRMLLRCAVAPQVAGLNPLVLGER